MVESAAIHMQSEFGLPVSLAIIDTSSKAAGYTRAGDENDAALNKILTTNLSIASQKTGAFFFGVDHFGKAAETGTRGSSAKESDVDVVLALLGDKGLNGKVANPRLALRKRRNGPVGAEYEFRTRVVAVGDDDTLVIEWGHEEGGAPAKKPDRWSKSLRLFKKALVNTLIDQGADSRPFPDGPMVRGVDIEALRRFYKSHPAEGDAKAKAETRRKAFGRAIKDAQDKELIGVRDILRDNRDVTLVWLAGPAGASNA